VIQVLVPSALLHAALAHSAENSLKLCATSSTRLRRGRLTGKLRDVKLADITNAATLCKSLTIWVHVRRPSTHLGELILILLALKAEILALQANALALKLSILLSFFARSPTTKKTAKSAESHASSSKPRVSSGKRSACT